MDADTFNKYKNYLVFAAGYDTATKSNVRLAQKFLYERQLSGNLIGPWGLGLTRELGDDVLILDFTMPTTPSRCTAAVPRMRQTAAYTISTEVSVASSITPRRA